ncbi:MAG: prepilin-type N-terminal cleavage/methylation domain-containing protein [Arcobacteraceae bacterium]|nr:prepilin-type N-terminal cleavage/methylation domain-containing protein [Arcobacteraceae bacterium]
MDLSKQQNMKKSMTLIEVLISLVLITIVITAALSVQSKSISFFDKMKSSSKNSSLISMAVYKNEQTTYLSELANFKDDDIDREFKKYKLKIDEDIIKKDTQNLENVVIEITTNQKVITLNSDIIKKYYSFKLDIQ